MSTFSTSLSGLDAEEQALSVISNDLSNLNTTAFKSGTPVFSDLFFQMLGTDWTGDPVQVGVGATMSSVSSPMTQGSITTTGYPPTSPFKATVSLYWIRVERKFTPARVILR